MEKETKIIGYKGFDKNLKCIGFQYEVGKEYKYDGQISLCESGFHFCENPQDVLEYYNAGHNNRFAIVEASGVSDERESDSKRVARNLKITEEISVFDMCDIITSTCLENVDYNIKKEINDYGVVGVEGFEIAIVGNHGAVNAQLKGIAIAGSYSVANAGNRGIARVENRGLAKAGNFGIAKAGNYSSAQSGNSGIAKAGHYSVAKAMDHGAAKVGDFGVARAEFDGVAQAGFCGVAYTNYAGSSCAGEYGVAIASTNGKVKGGLGCLLVVRDVWSEEDEDEYKLRGWACAIVDGVNIKENTWYRLNGGKLVECE